MFFFLGEKTGSDFNFNMTKKTEKAVQSKDIVKRSVLQSQKFMHIFSRPALFPPTIYLFIPVLFWLAMAQSEPTLIFLKVQNN